MNDLELRLRRIVFEYWKVPIREGNALLRELLYSDASRAVQVRHQLAASSENDLPRIFSEILAPHFMLSLVNDLRATRSLGPRQVYVIEDALLAATTVTGQWRG